MIGLCAYGGWCSAPDEHDTYGDQATGVLYATYQNVVFLTQLLSVRTSNIYLEVKFALYKQGHVIPTTRTVAHEVEYSALQINDRQLTSLPRISHFNL